MSVDDRDFELLAAALRADAGDLKTFLEVLAETAKQNPRFHLIATMTKMKDSHRDWTGETGFVSKEMLRKHLPAIQGPIFYLAGPPAMVAAMRSILAAAQVDEDDIRTEEFSGY